MKPCKPTGRCIRTYLGLVRPFVPDLPCTLWRLACAGIRLWGREYAGLGRVLILTRVHIRNVWVVQAKVSICACTTHCHCCQKDVRKAAMPLP